jgi:diguanylate cyclase (GGDEF)-like protein
LCGDRENSVRWVQNWAGNYLGNYWFLTESFSKHLIEPGSKSRDLLCLSLLILDVDHFKIYNDTYGHPAGDRCLQRIASAMEQLLYRPSDIVARYGGEEFAVILPGSDAEGAKIVAQRILDRVAELGIPHSGEAGGLVTISIGIATSKTRSDMSLEELISSADKALYKAKEGGRNRFVTDQPEGT